MSGAILVVGKGSFIAREFAARVRVRAVAHDQAADPAIYEGASCVINFAFAPRLHDGPFDPALDIDDRIAAQAARRGMHYVMMSSRRVYQEAVQWNASERTAATGHDAYGRNKLQVEQRLTQKLQERLTILRPGNVVGYEPIPGRRRFAAYLQNQLLERGRIVLTVHPSARRDLVPVGFMCKVLQAACERRIGGIFNVGAGAATQVGQAARWLIEGYGSGEIVAESEARDDEFQLDTTKLKNVLGLACPAGELEATLRDAGRRLAAEQPRPSR